MTAFGNMNPNESMPETIRIRDASPDDAERLLAIYRPYVTDTAVTFEYAVPDTDYWWYSFQNYLWAAKSL